MPNYTFSNPSLTFSQKIWGVLIFILVVACIPLAIDKYKKSQEVKEKIGINKKAKSSTLRQKK